jgi:hypothetical protein
MRLLPVLLLALLAGCASPPRTVIHTSVDGPLRIQGFSGGLLELSNRGPGRLGYEYRNDSGTLSRGEIGVGVRQRIDLTGVRELRLDCRDGGFSEFELLVRGGGDILVVPLPKE